MILDLDSQMEWGDAKGLVSFWGDHALEHATFARHITSQFNAQAPLFDVADQAALAAWLDVVDRTKAGERAQASTPVQTWLQQHNELHVAELQAMNANTTFDLSVLDVSDRSQFSDWLDTHQRLHALERQTLGI